MEKLDGDTLTEEENKQIISEIEDLNGILEDKQSKQITLDDQITDIKDEILRKEILTISLEMAKTSDATKDKNLNEKMKEELFSKLKILEEKKEALTQKLSSFNPAIANQFRTSTPTAQVEIMDLK
ncbi:unnamed protein product [Bemisia tabaci]|uniref:Uncharacterized protein n=1 Tax=Bemisia tabaci TaxID=7038 RepID=A0A9P0AD66_BEMTA|nr:unnamed protein product [Bemisia tabaci]